jgi:transposase
MEKRQGYEELKQALDGLHRKHPEAQFHVHIDAAGQYATNLIRYLRSLPLPLTVSVGEPARNKSYQKAFSPKRTCDDTESRAMARYGVVEKPTATPSVCDEFYILGELVGRLQSRVRDTTRAINRLHNVLARVFPELAMIVADISAEYVLTLLDRFPLPEQLGAAKMEALMEIPYMRATTASDIQDAAKTSTGSLKGHLADQLVRETVEDVKRCKQAEARIEELMIKAFRELPTSGHLQVSTIPGVGDATAAVLVAKIISIDRFETAKKLVGYFGTFAEENTSGVDKKGKPVQPGTMRMSHKGSDVARRYLWNATLSATKFNPAIRALYHRKRAEGKRHDVALGHCMRKLLHLVFAVWKTNTAFNPDHHSWDQEVNRSPEAQLPIAKTPQTQTVAGHKREVNPPDKVVTATDRKLNKKTAAVNSKNTASTSVDYKFLRQQVTMQQVLDHLGLLTQLKSTNEELRGCCPLHGSKRPNSRSLAINLSKNVFHCFAPNCQQAGNVLDFWAAYHKLPIHEAALHLAQTFSLALKPEQRRGARMSTSKST